MFLRVINYMRSCGLFLIWILISEILAILIRFDSYMAGFGVAIYEHVSAFIPSVRNVDVSLIWGMREARVHYAVMWLLLPAIVISLFLDGKKEWMSFMYRNKTPPTPGGWVIIAVCVISFYFFPIWEAGPLRYLVFSMWTFAIVSCFVVFAVAVFIRALMFEVFKI